MSPAQSEWVRLDEWKPDSAIVQSLTAVSIWPMLTPKQRELVAACRTVNNPKAEWQNKYKIQLDGVKAAGASKATLASLEAKGIVDERGMLTIPGIYTALWNQLEHDKDRQAERQSNRRVM